MNGVKYEIIYYSHKLPQSCNDILLNANGKILVRVSTTGHKYILLLEISNFGIVGQEILNMLKLNNTELEIYVQEKICALKQPVKELYYAKEYNIYDGADMYEFSFEEQSMDGNLVAYKFQSCIVLPQLVKGTVYNKYYIRRGSKPGLYKELNEAGIL